MPHGRQEPLDDHDDHDDRDDDIEEGDDDDDDMNDDDEDLDNDVDGAAESDHEARALVHALAGTDQDGDPQQQLQQEQQQQHEHIVDYCYRMGYFPANESFPNAATASRFRAAPLRPQRTLDKNPLTRRSWHPRAPSSWCAVLLQCGGQEVSDACTRCAEGQGFWTQCVVPNDWATSWITRGACANCYMDGKRSMCSRGFGMAVSPTARAKAAKVAAAQPAGTSSPEVSSSTTVATTETSAQQQFTSAASAPPVGAATTNNRPGRPSAQAQAPSHHEPTNQDFESLKRQYNRLSTSELDRLAEQSAAERARISLQLAAIDAVRAAREAFSNQQSNGVRH